MNGETKTLVLGLGNPILGDDGIGWRVVETLKITLETSLASLPVETDCLSVGGLSLMERMIDYDRVILVDAISTGNHPVGFVSLSRLEQIPNPAQGHLSSAHDTTLHNALAAGRKMGLHLPKEIWVVSIETLTTYEFSEQLSLPVLTAIPEAVNTILSILSSQFPKALRSLDISQVNVPRFKETSQ